MGSVTAGKDWWALLLFVAVATSVPAQQPRRSNGTAHTLFSDSAVEILQREYGATEISYLLFEAKSGALLASHWERYEEPIPLGSLVKPFTALAYAQAHDFHYPVYECKGKASGCWQEQGHGKLNITGAVSVSCNAYFRRLAENVTAEQLAPITDVFGLEVPEANFVSSNLIGLGEQWRISPLHMARAYLELYRRKEQPGIREILDGMRESGERGTGAAVDRQLKYGAALVKTGTAPCTHSRRAPADGFTLVLAPADEPEILLFIRVHSVPGAKAAETAGRMLRLMEE